MVLFNFLRFEPPSIRQARLRDTTVRLTGEVLSFTEQREDALRRFREVEQQQNLQFRQPTFELPTPEQRLTRQGRIFPDPALRGTDVGQRQQDLLPSGVTAEIRGRDARFVPETGRALIPADVFASPGGRGTIAHEGGHATELALPDRDRTLAELEQAFAALTPEERNRFFATAQEVQGQVGQSTIENRFGVGGPAELFADVIAVLRTRGPDAVPASLRAIVERPSAGTFTTGEITTPEQRLALSAPPSPAEVESALQRGGPSIIDAPRQLVKREVIDPLVPEFRVELPARPTSLLPPGLRETVELGAQATGVDLPETTVVTSDLVEEAASFVLDPLNLVFFAGPVLKGARGAARVAQEIRRTGRVPEFVKTAMRTARSEAGARPLRGGERVFPEELTTERVGEALRGFDPPRFDVDVQTHIAKADPSGVPPRKPPPVAGGATPDDPQFDALRRVALKGEAPEETLIRRHDAAIRTLTRDASIEVRENNDALVRIGLGRRFRQSVVAKTEGSFDELNRALHNPSKVASGDIPVSDELRPIYDKLRAQTDFEQAARIDFDPDQALVADYFFRGWQPPEGMFTGTGQRGALGRNPSFRLPRVDATYEEMIEAGFRPLFENPAEQARYSQLLGVRFREQMKLVDDIRTRELALPDAGGPLPEGWRVPEVGPAFEGKPYVDANGNAGFTRRVAVPESLATRLENAYGKTPRLKPGKAFGKTVDTQKLVDALVFLPKRAKLVGSVFQHVDFLSRSHFGAWTGFIDALRRGQPVNAVKSLVVWPKSAADIVRATFSPGFRNKLAKLAVDDTPLFKGRKLSNRMISESGLSLRDETLLPELDAVIREVLAEPAIVRMGKLPIRLLGDLERAWRKGLFEGVYPAAILTDVKNNIAPMIVRQHPGATDEQLAGMIAKAANTSYSTIPAATSVVQNQQARWFLTRFLFSMGENEGLLRAFTGAIRGENAAFFRTRLLGTYLGLMTLASTIHFASTGKPLPFDRFSPISRDKFGPLPFGYNTKFASPNIPLTGRNATEITLDVVGQMDTAFRLLDPKSFLSARMSVPARAVVNQATGKDFFGAPINEVGPDGVLSRASNLAQDLFLPIGIGQAGAQLLRENIEAAEGLINPGETRLGTAGIAVQATGVNLRAEPTRALVNRTRNEVIQELGLEGNFEDLDPAPRSQVTAEVENRIGDELELRRETARLRGQASTLSQQIEATAAAGVRVETEDLAPAAKGILDGDPAALEAYNKARTIFFASRRAVQESEIERLGLTPREREARTEQQGLVNAYYDLEPEPGPNGFVDSEDMDKFFAAQGKIFAKMNSETQEFIRSVSKVFTDPDVIAVEEMRLEAIEALKSVTALPKWQGLTVEEGDKVDDLVTRITADVQRFKAQATREGLEADAVTFQSTAQFLFDRGEITELDANNAVAISSGKAIREQGRIDLALEHRRVLLTIFPNFFDSVLPVGVEREELTEQEIGQLEPAGVSP